MKSTPLFLAALTVMVVFLPCHAGGESRLCELAKVRSDNIAPGDRFGGSVTLDNDILIVGASQEDGEYEDQGAVHIFSRVGDNWVEEQVIGAPDPAEQGFFGSLVAADDGVLAISCRPWWEDVHLVYVYEDGPSGWEQTAVLVTGLPDDMFSGSIAVSGGTIVVGARYDSEPIYRAGAVHVYVKDGGEWVEQARLTAPDAAADDHFGSGVAIDGDRIIASAPGDDTAGYNAGSAHVFLRSSGTWTHAQQIFASDGMDFDGFGNSPALQGDTLLLGAAGDHHGAEEGEGAVYVFEHDGASWAETAKLVNFDAEPDDRMGYKVALDGDLAAVAMVNFATNMRVFFLYSRAGGSWSEVEAVGTGISWDGHQVANSLFMGEGYLVSGISGNTSEMIGAAYVFGIEQGPCAPLLAVSPGPDSAAPNQVRGFDVRGIPYPLTDFDAFPLYDGYGTRVAAGDLDGDGRDELVTGPGPAQYHPTLIKGFSRHGYPLPELDRSAYGVDRFGLNVACGDLDGDGFDEVVTGPGPGAVFGPHVRGWNVDGGDSEAMGGVSFMAYGTLKYGVNVACGDIDGDGFDEIVTGAGPGAVFGPHVRGWDVDGGSASPIPGVSYFAYGTLKWGVNICCLDIDGDGVDEIVTGAGPGAVFGPHVRGWNYDGEVLSAIPGVSYFAYGTNRFGVRVTGGDLDQDGIDEIVTTPGPGQPFGAHVRGWNYDGQTLTAMASPNFFAFDSAIRYGADAAVVRR